MNTDFAAFLMILIVGYVGCKVLSCLWSGFTSDDNQRDR